jgi:orotate phosphoribosyltransferase-like protein
VATRDRWAALVAALLVGAAGCYHYTPQYRPLADALASPQDEVRVTLADSTELVLHSARAVGDSLIGWRASPTPGVPMDRVALAIADVRRVEVHRLNVAATVGVAFVGALAVATVALGVFIFVFLNALAKT